MTEKFNEKLPYSEIKVDDNIQLRQMNTSEAEDIFYLIDNDREYLDKWLPWVKETKSVNDSLEHINNTINERIYGIEYGYGIYYDNKIVGRISLMDIKNKPEIGYWVTSSMAGKGITTKAVEALSDFCFNTLGIDTLTLKADPENIGSNKVAEKSGFSLVNTEQSEEGARNIWILNR